MPFMQRSAGADNFLQDIAWLSRWKAWDPGGDGGCRRQWPGRL